MFENLSDKLMSGIKKIRGQGKITTENVEAALKEIRLGLLEADVNFKVVKQFITHVQEKALGQEVIGSLTAGQQIVKIVHEELVNLMGGENQGLNFSGHSPHIIMLVGLQGAGKTTTAAKLSFLIKKKGRQPLLVPVDVYRPAAIEQLKTLGKQNQLDVFDSNSKQKPLEICKAAQEFAKANGKDTLIIDTAGRLQIDDELMNELVGLKSNLTPCEILIVADAMTGQDAVNIAQGFHEKLQITGVVLTKLDGDARGGAALSIKATTGAPIKFIGTSEKVSGLEPFHPERIASRILDMGDVLSLVEKASEVFDEAKSREMTKKLGKNQFTLEDFRDQLKQIKKLGPLEGIMKMIPGMGQMSKQLKNMSPPDQELKKIEAIINSMTPKERAKHEVLNGSRRARIARGSGTQVSDINRFIKQFEQMQKMMQMMTKTGGKRGGPGGFPGGGMPF
ncbi:MAG: signal recognition particle protein [Oligoflexia bacterium]|nr:signal recognition particle protein [Oligoflexia bacterium]